MHDLITVIVPTYNTDKFIKRSINSLQKQTYSNIEILVVDDNSTDTTLKICQQLQKDDSRIKILSKSKNKGVANSRNMGIHNAKGKYIMFVDSDDYVDKDFCLTMLNTVKKYNADIAFCNFISVDQNNKKYVKLLKNDEGVVNHEKVMQTLITANLLWNKIFLKDMFSNVYFPEGKLYEDIRILYKLIDKANKIAYIPEYLYFYEQRMNSIVHTNELSNRAQYFEAIIQLAQFFKSKYPALFNEECVYLMPAAYEYCMNNNTKSVLYKKAIMILRENPIPKKLGFLVETKIKLIKISPHIISIFKLIKSGRIRKWIKKDR